MAGEESKMKEAKKRHAVIIGRGPGKNIKLMSSFLGMEFRDTRRALPKAAPPHTEERTRRIVT